LFFFSLKKAKKLLQAPLAPYVSHLAIKGSFQPRQKSETKKKHPPWRNKALLLSYFTLRKAALPQLKSAQG